MNLLPLSTADPHILDADLLLFRRQGLIAIAGRGNHSHAAKASRWEGELFCLEVREWHGGRAVTLASQVRKYPGRIDVFRANPHNRWPEFDRSRSTLFMRRLAGCKYGYAAIARAALLHLPVIRWWVRASTEDRAIDRRPPFCSQACAMADRLGGGVDPVPHLADRLTEPADLARSPFYEYLFTLTDDCEQEPTERTENELIVDEFAKTQMNEVCRTTPFLESAKRQFFKPEA